MCAFRYQDKKKFSKILRTEGKHKSMLMLLNAHLIQRSLALVFLSYRIWVDFFRYSAGESKFKIFSFAYPRIFPCELTEFIWTVLVHKFYCMSSINIFNNAWIYLLGFGMLWICAVPFFKMDLCYFQCSLEWSLFLQILFRYIYEIDIWISFFFRQL